jgi:hypothetical protein
LTIGQRTTDFLNGLGLSALRLTTANAEFGCHVSNLDLI